MTTRISEFVQDVESGEYISVETVGPLLAAQQVVHVGLCRKPLISCYEPQMKRSDFASSIDKQKFIQIVQRQAERREWNGRVLGQVLGRGLRCQLLKQLHGFVFLDRGR